jgi:hypothetical protein
MIDVPWKKLGNKLKNFWIQMKIGAQITKTCGT